TSRSCRAGPSKSPMPTSPLAAATETPNGMLNLAATIVGGSHFNASGLARKSLQRRLVPTRIDLIYGMTPTLLNSRQTRLAQRRAIEWVRRLGACCRCVSLHHGLGLWPAAYRDVARCFVH